MKTVLLALMTPLVTIAACFGIAYVTQPTVPAHAQAPQRFYVVRQYQVESIGRTLAILRDAKTGACFLYAKDEPGMYAGAGSLTAASQDVCSEDK